MVCLEIYNKNATVFSYNIFAESLQSKGQLQLTAQEHAKVENPKEKRKKKKKKLCRGEKRV